MTGFLIGLVVALGIVFAFVVGVILGWRAHKVESAPKDPNKWSEET